MNYTISLANELRSRLPDNVEILQQMSLFSVGETLKHNKSLTQMTKLADLLGSCPATIDTIINQWRSIHFQKWGEITNTVAFWAEVKKFRDSAGMNPYDDLASVAVSVL